MTRTHRSQGRERNRVGQQRARRARRLLLEFLEDRRLLAFDAQLVADINALQSDDASSSPEYFVQLGDVAYFTAETPAAGRELWRSDGTAAGTFMVKDINAGAGDAFYSGRDPFLTNVNGTLFFTANDGANGYELWKSDGTDAGTKLVKVINTRDGSSLCEPALLTELNGLLFFRAGAATYDMYGPELDGGPELWVSDGTEAGTKRVKDIDTTGKFGGSQIREITNFNGTLFFRADDGIHGSELWKSDGTEANTVMVKDLRPGNQYSHSGPSYLTPVGGKLFFVARDDEHYRELWVSDGTEANTYMVKDIGNHWGEPWHLTAVGDTLFFYANDGSSGWELWKSDGTEANTVMVKDINPGTGTSTNTWNSLTNVNGTLFFSANDGTNGYELWKSDGTEANTVRVKDITGNAPSAFRDLTNVNGTLFFAAWDEENGFELWKTDGTPASTVLIKDIRPGSDSAYPGNLANINGTLFFSANDGSSHYELWKSDGTAENTVLVKDLNTATQNSSPWALVEVGGTVFFSANDGTHGFELWKSDGATANTVLVKDINAGSGDSYPRDLTNVSGTLFFSANDGTNGYQLWKSDGTPESTVLVKNMSAGVWDSLAELTNVNGMLFFRADDGVHGYELWKSDGTAENTVLVKDIFSGDSSSYPKHLTNVDGTLFFRANDGASGYELWKSDGTAENTVLVKDINPGSADSEGWNNSLTNVNGTLFFSADDGIHGQELWKSDGTAENTVLVKDVYAGSDGSYAYYLTNVNGTLFFSADDSIHGQELWKSDGTAENTVLVKDMRPGESWASSRPGYLSAVGGTLFFTADGGGAYGRELWKSDGTEANTVMVKDIRPGTTSSGPESLTHVDGALYFTAEEGIHGRELWTSDGSEAGTVLVKDIRPGSDSSSPYHLTVANGTLFFRADDGFHGKELWQAFPLASTPSLLAEVDANGNLVISDVAVAGAANRITVQFSGGNVVIADANEQFAALPAEIVNAGGWLSNDDKTLTVPLASITGTKIVINGAGGVDTLTTNLTNPLGKLLEFHGGEPTIAPGDALIVRANAATVYTPSATTTGDGTIQHDSSSIHFTGLEPVDFEFLVPAPFTLDLPGGDDLVNIANGTLTDGSTPALTITGSSGGVAFEAPNVRNASLVTIDTTAVAGMDTITITSANNAHLNQSLAILTGVEAADVIDVNGPAEFSGSVSLSATNVNSTAAGTIQTGTGLTVTNTGAASALAGAISGSGSVTKDGSGTLALSVANSHTGGTTVNGGTLRLGASGALPASRRVTVDAMLDLNGYGPTIGGLDGSGVVTSGTAGALTLTVGGNNQGGNFSGVIEDGSGTVSLTKGGSGTQQLTGTAANTFTGATTINAGILALGKTAGVNAIGSTLMTIGNNDGTSDRLRLDASDQIPDGATVVLNATAVGTAASLDLNGRSETIAGLSSAVSTVAKVTNGLAASTSTLTVGSGGATSSFGGVIENGSGTVALTKTGNGTFNLTGTNTYTGATTVSGGTLLVVGSTASGSAVTVGNSATLGGSGSVSGPVSAASGGTVSPGTSPGVLHAGSVTFVSGSVFDIELNGTSIGTDYDQLNVTGTVVLGGATLAATAGNSFATGDTFVIISNDGTDVVSGTFAGWANGANVTISGQAFRIFYNGGDGNDVVLVRLPDILPTVYVDDDFANPVPGQDPDGDGPAKRYLIDSFPTIQQGIDAVDSAGTVYVNAGTYTERLTVNKPLTLSGVQAGVDARGRSATESIVQDPGTFANPKILIDVATGVSGVTIDGFMLNGTPTLVNSDDSVVRLGGSGYSAPGNPNFSLLNNRVNGTYGLIFRGGSNLIVDQNEFTVNKTGVAVQQGPAANVSITANDFIKGTVPADDVQAIYLTGVSGGVVSDNDASNFTGGALNGSNNQGVDLAHPLVISGNTFTGNKKGVNLWGNTQFVDITGNTITGSTEMGINVKGADLLISGNLVAGSTVAGIVVEKHTINTERVTVSGNDFRGASATPPTGDNATDLRITSTVTGFTVGAGNLFAGDTYFIDNQNAQNIDLTSYTSANFEGLDPATLADNFRIEDKMRHGPDGAGLGVITWVEANLYVTTPGTGANNESIQNAVDAASDGDTVNVEAGGYSENLTVNKRITLDGAGSGNTAADTVITSAAGNTPVIQVTGSGLDDTHRLIVQDLRVTGATGGENPGAGILVHGTSPAGYLTFSNVAAVGNQGSGIAFNNTVSVTDVAITNANLSNNGIGLRIASAVPSFDTLAVSDSQINSNASSGFTYNPLGTLTNVGTNFTFTNTSFSNNSTAGVANQHDLSFFGFHGNATLTNVSVNSGNGSSANSNSYGIVFTNATALAPAGTISLNGVTVTGHVGKGALSFQYYNDVNNISLTDVDVTGVTAPWGQVIVHHTDTDALNLGNTKLKTLVLWTTGGVNATAADFYHITTGAALSKSILADNFQIEDQVAHALDVAGLGLVRWVPGHVYVTPNSGSIQRGINAAASGDTVNVQTGSYTGGADAATGGKDLTLAAGSSPGQVTVNGDLTLDSGDTLAIELNGADPATQFDNWIVNGNVTLGGATLAGTLNYTPAVGQAFVIIGNNDATDPTAVSGTFANAPNNGDTVTATYNAVTYTFHVFYTGGDGNDVVLVEASDPPSGVFVDDDWAGYAPGQFIADADDGTAADEFAVFGVNAFATVSDGIDAAASGGTVIVNDGTYPGTDLRSLADGKFLQLTKKNQGAANSTVTIASLDSAIGTTIDLGSNTLIMGNSDSIDNALAGAIAGAGGNLTKQGTDTLTLSGASTYSGATTIDDGRLLVNTNLANTSGVTVNNGGILGGTGTVSSSVTISGATAQVAPGDSLSPDVTDDLTVTGNVVFGGTGRAFAVELGGVNPGTASPMPSDQLDANGVTLADAALNVSLVAPFTIDNNTLQQFLVVDNTSGSEVSGTFANQPEGSQVNFSGNKLYVTYAGGVGNNDVILSSQPIVNGTIGNDTLVLRKISGGGTDDIEFSLNGAAWVQLTAAPNFAFDGLGGTDLMLVDTSNGDPIPAGNVTFAGEILRVQRVTGDAAETATFAPSATAGQGTVTLNGMGDILFTGATNVDFANLSTVNLQTGTANDTIGVAGGSTATNGGTVPGGYSIDPTENGLAFTGLGATVGLRTVTNANLSTVTGGGDGDDGFTIDSDVVGHGVTNLSIDTGGGNDNVTVLGSLTLAGTLILDTVAISQTGGTLTAATVKLDAAGGNVTQSGGDIVAGGLELIGGGSFTLNSLTNNVATLAANLTSEGGSLAYTDADALTVGTVGATTGITTTDRTTSGTTGGVTLDVRGGSLTVTGSIITGSATVADTGASDVASSGGVSLTAATGISGAGQIITGSVEMTGAGLAGPDMIASGSISLNLTGTGDVGLSAADALTVGTAARTGGNDAKSAGNITIVSADRVNSGTEGSPLSVLFGAASGGGTNNQGILRAATDGGTSSAGELRIRSTGTTAIRIGALDTADASSQNVHIQTGGALTQIENWTLDTDIVTIVNLSGAMTQNAVATTAGDLTLDIFGALTQNGTIAASGTVTLNTDGAATQGAGAWITATNLLLLGDGAKTLTESANDVATLAADIGWSGSGAGNGVSYTDADTLTVGSVGATTGITTADRTSGGTTGGVTINVLAGSLTVSQPIATGSAMVADLADSAQAARSGTVTLNAAADVVVGAGVYTGDATLGGDENGNDDATTGAIAITATAGAIALNSVVQTGLATQDDNLGSQDTLSGNITLVAATAIGGDGRAVTGAVLLTNADDGANDGPDTITSGSISLNVTGTGDVGLSAVNALEIGTAAKTGAGDNTKTAGNITVICADRVNNGTEGSPLSVLFGAATGGGTSNQGILRVTTDGGAGNAGEIRVTSTGTSTIRGGALDTADGSSQNVHIETAGALNQMEAWTLDTDIVTVTTAGAMTQGSSGSITAAGLELLGDGAKTLTNAANNVTTLAAYITGVGNAISFIDADTLIVGTVNATGGLTTATRAGTNGATGGVTLDVLAGSLTVNQPIVTGGSSNTDTNNAQNSISGSVRLTAATDVMIASTVTTGDAERTSQTGGTGTDNATSGDITVVATAGAILVDADVTTGAATQVDGGNSEVCTTGSISFTSDTGITGAGRLITGATSLSGADVAGTDTATSGSITLDVTGGGGVGLNAANALTIGAVMSLGSASLDTAAAGTITVVSADRVNNGTPGSPLQVLFGGATGATTNTQGILRATTDGGAGSEGELRVTSTGATAIQVGALDTADASSQDVQIQTAGELIQIEAWTLDTDIITVSTAGAMTQSGASSSIVADQLALLGAGQKTVMNAGNNVATLAANITGAGNGITYTDADALIVGTAAGTVGVSAPGAVQLATADNANQNDLTINAAVQSSGSSVTLWAGDDFTLAAGGSVSAGTTVVVHIDRDDADSGTGATALLNGPISSGSGATLNGNADVDTVTVNRLGTGGLTIDLKDSGDTVIVNLGPTVGGAIGSAIAVLDMGGSGTDKLYVTGGEGLSDSFAIDGSQLTRNATETVTYDMFLEELYVNGLNEGGTVGDMFTVTPSLTMQIFIDGDDPASVTPGDRLIYQTPSGQTATQHVIDADSGYITATGGYKQVNYDEIESLVFGGDVVVNGTGFDDHIVVTATGEDSGSFVVWTDSGSGFVAGPTVGFAGLTKLTFNGLAGDDVMTIDYDPAATKFLNPQHGVFFHGGTQNNNGNRLTALYAGLLGDTLQVFAPVGESADKITHRLDPVGADGHVGLITIEDTPGMTDGVTTISYTGLEPVLDAVPAVDREFHFTAGAETVTLTQPGQGGLANKIGSDLSETVSFNNPSGSLTIDTTAGSGSDTINIQGLASGFSADLTVTAKTGGSGDPVNFQTSGTDLGSGNLAVTAKTIHFSAAVTTTGNAALTADGGGISDGSDDNAPSLMANQTHLTVTVSGNLIGANALDRFEVDVNRLQVSAAGSDAFLRNTAGNVDLYDSSVGAGSTFDLVAVAGNITSGTAGDSRDVLAGILVLETTGSGSTIGTSTSDRLNVDAVTRLDAKTAGGLIVVRDLAGDFPIGAVDAGGGNVDLLTTVGAITDANGATLNVTADVLTAEAASGIALDTSVNAITATTTGTGAITIKETDAVTLTSVTTNNGTIEVDAGGTMTVTTVTAGGAGRDVRLKTSSGNVALGLVTAAGDKVLLQAAGAITGIGSGNNVNASQLAMQAGTGIGAGDAIETTVGTLAALAGSAATDHIQVANTGDLTIGSVTAFSIPVTGVTGGGDVLLTTTDRLGSSDDLTVNGGVTVQSTGGNVTLRAGDDLTLSACSTVSAEATGKRVTLLGDFGDLDDGLGSTMTLNGTIASNLQIIVEGDDDADTIIVNPDTTNDHSIDSIKLDGKAGNDTYRIWLGALNGGPNAVDIADDDAGSDSAFVYGTANADILTVHNNVANGDDPQTGGFVKLTTPSETVNYTETLEFLTVAGGAGSDLFLVQPSQTAVITIEGGAPGFGPPPNGVPSLDENGDPTVPGDTIEFDSFGERFNVLCGRIYTLGGDPEDFQVVRYFGIENLPLHSEDNPIGTSELHFDFDWTPAETQQTPYVYTSVLPTTLYGVDGNTYGWNAVVNGFDRGAAMVIGTEFDDLLRDGHWESGSRTFSADVADGWYLVSVKTGDASFARDRLQVVDANTATVLVERVGSAAGQFEHPTFVVLVEEVVQDSGIGTLALTFNNLGGDPYWSINGLDIWPGSLLGIGSPDPDPVMVADGLTVETFTGYGATKNSLITVSAWLDATGGTADVSDGVVPIISVDVDDRLAGVQVPTDEDGQFTYSFLRPSAAGKLVVQFSEPTGEKLSCQTFQLAQVDYHRFDFDGPAVDTQGAIDPYKEFLSVRGGDLFTRLAGYGWNQTMNEFERPDTAGLSETAVKLYRDGHSHSASRTFQFQAVGSQTYDLRVYTGDRHFSRDQLQITVEGAPVQPPLVATAANQFAKVQINGAQDLNNDGYITVTFVNQGGDPYWVVNGIDVAKSGELPPVPQPPTPVPGGYRFDFESTAVETAAGFIRVGTVNAFDGLLGYGWAANAQTFSRSGPNDLLKDGHFAGNNTFSVNVQNATYRVSVTLGDANFPRDNISVWAEGNPVLSDLATAAGEFIHRSFDATVTDGQLNVQIASTSGDPYFTINALEIWQIAPVNKVLNHGLDDVVNGGVEFTGTATPGAWVTVQTSAGSIDTEDENDDYAGVQVLAHGTTGAFSFTIVPPVSGGVVTVTSEEVTGEGRGSFITPAFPGLAAWEFDFNAAGSPNFGTYTNVGATNVYDAELGYGWTSNASTFNRSGPTNLLRDGHWGTSNTFNVDVPDGDYFVNVTFGDASFARNNLAVKAEGATQPQLRDIATAAGQFFHDAFEVNVTGGQLNLQVYSAGGDPYFTINALEVRPVNMVKAHNLQMTLNPNGSYTVSGSANDDAIVTVSTTLGSVAPISPATDADTARAGLQVVADGDGDFSFIFNPPAGGGTATIRTLEIDGGGRGEREDDYDVPAVRRFDFNGSANDTELTTDPEFTGVRGNTLYNANNGYGWTQSVSEFQRTTTSKDSDALYRDGHWGSAVRTFQVAAIEDTLYSVRVYVGDASFLRNNIQISVEGGAWQTVANTAANVFTTLVVPGTSTNDDGLLTISIRNNGGDPYWVINGMDVWEGVLLGPNDPGEAPLLAATWSTEMVGGQLTQAAVDAVLPVARQYWVSTGLADWQVAELYRTPVAIGDLSYRGALGVAKPEGIWLDASGAGLGWNVGSSQWSVVSGQWLGDISHQRTTANGQLPTAAYDLLTVLTHELGHMLGYDDLDPLHHSDHIMAGVLQPGTERIGPATGGRGPLWVAGAERDSEGAALIGPAASGRGPQLVDRVIDDLLRDD
ncbi:MAG: autotransporter-associated beta strand repeat-containing protein, partial [Pirellulaceae bacterium]|nr:autotransporter-associated beta strand repeat-containing protein [Pirellulaceae bacterium]